MKRVLNDNKVELIKSGSTMDEENIDST